MKDRSEPRGLGRNEEISTTSVVVLGVILTVVMAALATAVHMTG